MPHLDQQIAHHLGHRKRLKDKFEHYPDSLNDYELLELFLCLIVPRQDMKPLAKVLLIEFPSLTHLIHADPAQLKLVKGVGQSVMLAIRLLKIFHHRLIHENSVSKTLLTAQDIVTHCKQRIGFHCTEHILVLFLDNQQRLIRDEIVHQGTVDRSTLYPREILRKALDLSASSLILSHNHPGGDPTPSQQDIRMTYQFVKAAAALDIAVLDHIIVSDTSYTSLRQMGLMD